MTNSGMVGMYRHCENQSGGSQRNKNMTYHMTQLYHWVQPKDLNTLLQRYLDIHVHCCSVHNRQETESNAVHVLNRILPSCKGK